jgi:hypothetical protein
VIAGDLRTVGSAGGGINGSDSGSGDTESWPELSALPYRSPVALVGCDVGFGCFSERAVMTSSVKRDLVRVRGRTEGDCCFLARDWKVLLVAVDGRRLCLRARPGEDGTDDAAKPLSTGE